MRKNFRTFDLAVRFYRSCQELSFRSYIKDQLYRAAHSIALNLAEGRGKRTLKDQKRYFHNALGSVRECQAILILEGLEQTEQWELLDRLAGSLFRLIERAR
ncbi:MAG: four helix bundle protein [Bdellovibrionota bacterium]